MFSRHKTKWIQLGNYSHAYTDYVVFVRGNKKTGMMEFKVKKVHAWTMCTGLILPANLIDVRKQWEEITNALKSV